MPRVIFTRCTQQRRAQPPQRGWPARTREAKHPLEQSISAPASIGWRDPYVFSKNQDETRLGWSGCFALQWKFVRFTGGSRNFLADRTARAASICFEAIYTGAKAKGARAFADRSKLFHRKRTNFATMKMHVYRPWPGEPGKGWSRWVSGGRWEEKRWPGAER